MKSGLYLVFVKLLQIFVLVLIKNPTGTCVSRGRMSTDIELAKKEPEESVFSEITQKAGDFLTDKIDGIVDLTKSGLSFGERFTLGLYNKITKWSKKWFTHAFLFLVIVIYSVLGALSFQAIEGENNLILK